MSTAKSQERVKGVSFNILPSQAERLRELAFRHRTTISEQVRRALARYLGAKGRGR